MGDRAAAAVRGLGGTPFAGFALPFVAVGACIWDMGCVGWETFRSRLSLYCWDGGTGCSSRSLGGDERERKRLPKKLLFFSLSFPVTEFFDVERSKGISGALVWGSIEGARDDGVRSMSCCC